MQQNWHVGDGGDGCISLPSFIHQREIPSTRNLLAPWSSSSTIEGGFAGGANMSWPNLLPACARGSFYTLSTESPFDMKLLCKYLKRLYSISGPRSTGLVKGVQMVVAGGKSAYGSLFACIARPHHYQGAFDWFHSYIHPSGWRPVAKIYRRVPLGGIAQVNVHKTNIDRTSGGTVE